MSLDQATETIVQGQYGRDADKRFRIHEVAPLDMATFVLRLLAAIRLGGVDELRTLMNPTPDADEIDTVLRLLAGCDPEAVRALASDALKYVQIAPDPQHPGMFRALRDDDIKELKTLGAVLGAFARTNVTPSL
jgi:hypothetical protein